MGSPSKQKYYNLDFMWLLWLFLHFHLCAFFSMVEFFLLFDVILLSPCFFFFFHSPLNTFLQILSLYCILIYQFLFKFLINFFWYAFSQLHCSLSLIHVLTSFKWQLHVSPINFHTHKKNFHKIQCSQVLCPHVHQLCIHVCLFLNIIQVCSNVVNPFFFLFLLLTKCHLTKVLMLCGWIICRPTRRLLKFTTIMFTQCPNCGVNPTCGVRPTFCPSV